MATEADIPEAISVTKEGEGRYLTSGEFDITISQCSPVQVNKSEGELDQHLETAKCFAEGENTQGGCSAQVESKNSSFGISEGGSFLASLSDSKVDKQETCVSENSQGDESNQAEMEILDKEDQLLRGKEFGVVEETGSKEKEVVEEIDKKAEQHIESHGIANDLDEHVQVISDQRDSINENPQCVEKEAKSSQEDVKGRQMADEIADSSSEQVSVLLEERSFQEDEAAVRTLDLTNNSFKKDIKPETSIDENTDNTSSTNTIFQEEFEEETGIKGLKNKAPESFDAVYEEKGPEATVFNNDKSTDDDSSSTIVAGPDIPNDEATLEAKECAEDKLQMTSMTDDIEEKAGLEVGKKENEAPGIPDTPLITQTEETHLPEVGNPYIFEVYPEIGSEDIIKESPKEPEYQNKFLEETPEASDTASDTVKDDESSERHFGSPCMKHEENTQRKREALDVGEAKAGEEEDSQGFAAVGPIQETEQSNMNSAEHEGETETNLVEQIESAHYDIERPLNLNSEENDTETLRENTKTITTDEAERQVINLEQSFKTEGKEDTAIPSYEITEDEIPEEKVLKEPEISGGGESTTRELNKNIEIPENILNTSTVKCEEGEQGEGKNTAPTKATEEDQRDEDPFTVEVAEEDHDYNSAISVTETSAKVTSNDEEDAPQALQKYEPGGELQNVLDVMPEDIKTETSRESAEVIICRKEERTIQNSQESSDKEKKEDIESTNNTEENDTAVVEACTKAADLSTIIEEKNLEEQEIQKLSSSLVVEETTKEISEEEEIYGVILKEERKEAHAKCKEPAEGANLTQDLKSETTEDRTETDKDIYAPISEGETHAEESKKTFVPKNSFLSDVPEMEIEKHFQVNYVPTVSNFDSVSGIVSQVTSLEEAETENQEQEKKNDIAPEEKVLPTIFTSEKIEVQEEENFNSKDKLENQIPTTADKPETCLKEAEAENKEHVQNIDPEEKGVETILTDKTALDIEDIAVQAGENFNSKENLEEQIPTAADEGETFWKEAEAENKKEIKHTDIASEEKGQEIILTDETALNIEDVNVQAEENLNSKDNLEKQIPTSADEGETFSNEAEAEKEEEIKHTDIAAEEKGLETILTDETALDIEDIYVQAEENFNSKENLEEQIPTAADEGETFWKEVEAENKEEIKHTDIASEEKGLETDETALDIEDINVQAEENLNSKDNLEEQIPTSADEGETFSNEAEAENKEGIKHTDIAPDGKGLETILTDETALEIEDIYVQAEENFNSKDNLEEQIPTTADEHESCLKEAQAENKEQVKNTDIIPEEKGLVTILTDGTSLDIEDIYVQAEETFNANENLEGQIPKAVDEGETFLKEVEAQNEEQAKNIDIAHEEKGLPTILTDETALDIEDNDVQAEENFNLKENLGKEIQTTADERETFLKEAEAENQEQVKTTDIVPEEKDLATILTDETSLDVEDIDVQAEQNFKSKENLDEQIPTAANEGETCLKEAESENKEQTKDINIVPEEKGLATILTDETASEIEDSDVQAEDNFNSEENLEKQFPTAADEVETCLKEAKAENKEQVKDTDIVHEEKCLATVLTDDTSLDVEDIDVQAEQNFNSKENLEEQIPTAADEDKTCFKDAETENKEQTKTTYIAPEEKGIATISAVETALDIEDIDVKAEENLEKQIPTAANEGEICLKEAESKNKEQTKDINIAPEEKGLATTLTDETASEIEDSDVQVEENFNSKENLEKQFPTAADEVETCLKEAKAENKEQVKDTDIVHEEKGLATVLTDDTSLDVEDIDVQAEQYFNSKENLEEQIPTAADEDKTCFKDAETENKEQTKTTDIAPEEKGLATISAVETATISAFETALVIEDIDLKAEENFNSKEILEKQIPTAANEREICLKEAESENKEQTKDIDIAPEEKGLATTLTDETAPEIEDSDVQAEEKFNSKENLEKQFPTAADEVETCLKEAKAENKEQVKDTDIVHEEKGLATVLTDDTSLDVEDIDVQAEQNFNSKENLEEQIPTAADEDKTCFKDAETENKEQTKTTDIAPEEKGLATISAVETALDVEDTDVQAEQNFKSKENLDKQIPTAANEGETCLKEAESENKEQTKDINIAPEEKGLATILIDEMASEIEDSDVQAEENFNSKENFEKFPTAADEVETRLKEAKTENKEQVEDTDIVHEEKGLATVLTDDTSLDVEDIDVQAEQNFNSKENLEEHIPTAADEDKTCFKDAEIENKEQTKTTGIAPEEKGLATISAVETALDIEDNDVKAEENFNSKEILEKQITTAADEGETGLKDAEAEKNEQVKNDIAPEEKALATILTDETLLGVEDIDVQAEQNFNSKENLEEHIPAAADEDGTCLKEAKAENKEQVKDTDIVHEEKGLATVLKDDTSMDVEDIAVQAEQNFNSKENLEEQIPTAADEDKTCFKDAETENKEQIKTTDTAPEEKGLATISAVETALEIEDIDVKAEEIFNSKEILEKQITTAADEGETGLKDAETENHEKEKNDIAPEERVLATILTDEMASEIEDSDVQAEESFNLKENLEKQIPTAADEGETGLKESESEHNERVENDIAPEEKVLATILTDETALDIEDIYVEAEGNFDSTEFLENQIPTEAGKTSEQSFQVQSLEEADPTLGVEDESHESEDHPEKNNMIVEEPQWLQVFDKPKITGRDLNKEEILEGNVTFSPESIEEDTGNNSQEIEKEIKNLKEEGSSVESMKEGNGDDLSPEYIPEDESEKFKEDKIDAVKSKEEILEESHTAGIDESTVSETNKIAEEILNTLPVKYEEGQQGEGNIPASAKASEEEDPIEDTFPVKLAEVEDDDISTVAVIETSARVIGEEGSPRAVQKYEPGEGLQKLLDVMPEETKAESSRENAQVITCTKEERAIQNIKESNEEDTNAINDTKEKDTGSEEVLERTSREQETGEHALQEIHPQEFNDKETTEDNSTEYQACIEAADFSTKIVQGNLEEQANRELSSSLVGDNIIKESSEEEENYVSNLKEEKKEAHEECKEPVEVTNMIEEETNSETFEDKRKPNEDLCTPISEEETHAEESNSFQSEVSEKDGSTVINSDSVSGIVRHQTVLKEAEAENKEQVENTDTALDEKGLATILTDGTTLDVEGIDEQSDENSNSKEFSESQIPTVAVVDEGEEKVGLGNINLDDAPVNFQVQSLEEAEPTLRVEDENNNMIAEEVKPQLLDQVFDEPKNIEGDFNKGQIIEANAAIFSPELIQEETVKNSQDNDKETEKLKEEGSSIENIKELTANDLQLESIPEDGSEKFKDDKLEAVKFKGEILQELHAAGVGEGTACETSKIAEGSEEIFYTLPVKYEEGPLGEGNSPTSAKASNEEDKDEETFSVKVAEDDDSNNGAVTVTETSEKVTSNEEGDSSQSLEKDELGEEVQVKTSDLAYENKVYNLEVKASFAERTAEETSLRKEGHKEVSDLALEKLDVDATEEEIREGSEIVPKSDSQSIDVVSKDDIIACQALHEGISKEQLQIPSSTLLPEEKELKSNQHEHETTTQDKNIEEEHTHEREVPADENTGDLFAARSVEEAHLQKEEPRELKASELSLEKLDAGESEEKIKESFETASKSDCLSIDAVSKDEIIADQTPLEGIKDVQLQIPSHSLLPKEEELKTYEHEHGITTQDKSIEEEHAKKIEMPADENGGYLFAARSVEETILHKEEPRELKVSELAPEELNADETEEIKETFETVSKADSQSTDVVSKDEIIAYQMVHEGISKEQLQIPSSILLHEEKEIKASEDEHGTTSEDICPQKEEPKDAKVSEMALKTLNADETAEETEETCETANKFASQSIDVVTQDEVVDDQTLCKVILKETPSTAFLTGETKHATITTTEEENMSNVQIQDDENGNATSTAEENSLPKEEPSELKVSDVELYSSEELQKESSNEVHEEERSSLIGVPEVEPHEDEERERYDDSPLGNQKTTELKGTTMEASNLDIETNENASDCAPEEGFSRSQDATINRDHLKNEANEANETNETIKNEVSNEQKHLEVAISDSRAEERWCETTIEANETRKNEVSNEEIEAKKLEVKELRPISVSGENISHREQENELIAEKYEGEKSESFNTARNENRDNEESPKETTQVAKHLTEDKELQTEENLCDTTVEANEKIKTGLSNDEIKEDKELPKDSEADSVREESHQEKKAIAEEYQVEKTNESSVIRTNENRGELPEEKDTTAGKEVQTEAEEEEHENAEEVKTYEETGENEHKNAEPGYDSPVFVEASRDADAKISHKKSHNILSGIKHSISKVKKAITGKSSHSKTQSEK